MKELLFVGSLISMYCKELSARGLSFLPTSRHIFLIANVWSSLGGGDFGVRRGDDRTGEAIREIFRAEVEGATIEEEDFISFNSSLRCHEYNLT